jgi:leucyl aminopeptidase
MDSLAPPKPTLRVAQSKQQPTLKNLDKIDQLLVLVPTSLGPDHWPSLPAAKQLARLAGHSKNDAIPRAATRLTNSSDTGVSVTCFDPGQSTFQRLTRARQVVSQALREHPGSLGVYAAGFAPAVRDALIEAVTIASSAAAFELPCFKSGKTRRRRLRQLRIFGVEERLDLSLVTAAQAGNDLARWLTALPPNKLTAASYQSIAENLAAEHSCEYRFLDENALRELGAGAFLAVSQGNRARDAGVIHLRYRPSPEQSRVAPLALIGKGILFDTGGTNLKPFKSMLDMHTDMGGSAVALGIFLSLARLKVPYPVDAWLAITENRISADAYKSQDVVTAANGKTIQVIHTDAEGRMVLADTLALAAREKPALMLDFATLTGSCVAALTQRYCGIFSNRPAAYPQLTEVGATSGERVWAFPMDADYDEAISSDIADIKQCAEAGFGDHILAARFLSKFVPDAIPWVHMDLSAADNKGGLGAIPTNITGFGVHYTLQLLQRVGSPGALAAQLDQPQ